MSLIQFVTASHFLEQTEINKTRLLAFYHLKVNGKTEFAVKDVTGWFETLNLAAPNTSRLKQNILKSNFFVRAGKSDNYKLHAREISILDSLYPKINQNEEVKSLDSILPESLYLVGRSYIESIAKQINASYEHNIYDGCAVLMRRLIEILLIHAYEKLGIAQSIKDSNGNYYLLERIVQDAISNSSLTLSRNTKDCLDKFRTLGNFSAHKIFYVCKPSYIQEVILDYRATIEELLHKSGLKT